MNASKLKEIARRTETSQMVIDFFARRRRNTVYTAFSGLRADLKRANGKPVDSAAMELTFKELEGIGVGKMIRSDRGTAKGFLWTQPVRDIGPALKAAETPPPTMDEAKRRVEGAGAVKGVGSATVVVIRKNRPPVTVERDESEIQDLLN